MVRPQRFVHPGTRAASTDRHDANINGSCNGHVILLEIVTFCCKMHRNNTPLQRSVGGTLSVFFEKQPTNQYMFKGHRTLLKADISHSIDLNILDLKIALLK